MRGIESEPFGTHLTGGLVVLGLVKSTCGRQQFSNFAAAHQRFRCLLLQLLRLAVSRVNLQRTRCRLNALSQISLLKGLGSQCQRLFQACAPLFFHAPLFEQALAFPLHLQGTGILGHHFQDLCQGLEAAFKLVLFALLLTTLEQFLQWHGCPQALADLLQVGRGGGRASAATPRNRAGTLPR